MTSEEHNTEQPDAGNKYPGLEIAFEEAKRRIDVEFNQVDGLDVKASIFIVLSGVLLTLTMTVLPASIRHIDYLTIGLVLCEFLYAFLSLFCAIIAIIPQRFENAPSIESLRYYLNEKEKVAKFELFEEFEGLINRNESKIRTKVHFVNLSLILLLVSTILFPNILLYQLLLVSIQ